MSRKAALLLMAILLLTLISPVYSAGPDWQLRFEQDGIRIFTRLPNGEKHQEFLAEVTVQSTIAQAIALLQDNSACTRWLYRCEESHVIREVSRQERYFYQVSSLPFPAKTRDAIFHARVSYNPDQSVTVEMQSVPDEIPGRQYVRIRHAAGHYHLQALSATETTISWQMFIDPAGALPAWIVNAMLTDLPFQSLKAFRELVQTPPWSSAEFRYDEAGVPNDIVYRDSRAPQDN